MKRYLLVIFTVVTKLYASMPSLPPQIIVKLHDAPYTRMGAIQLLHEVTFVDKKNIKPMANDLFTVRFPEMPKSKQAVFIPQTLKAINRHPSVAIAIQDKVGQVKVAPVNHKTQIPYDLNLHLSQWDEMSPPQGIMLESNYGLRDGAWFYTDNWLQKPTVVAVLDTGMHPHIALNHSLFINESHKIFGWNFAGSNDDLSDETESYHGMHVAGTIAGMGQGFEGVSHFLKILPVKIPDNSGLFYESTVINAIYWAIGDVVPNTPANPYPARVINMSFGVDDVSGQAHTSCDDLFQNAIDTAYARGVNVIVAAGNANGTDYNAPATCHNTTVVAATNPKGLRAHYSNYGSNVDIAAPGGDFYCGEEGGILSTVHNPAQKTSSSFAFKQGTSMAAPHVAGVAGIIHAINDQSLGAADVASILYYSTHFFGESTNMQEACIGSNSCGHGILNALQAVKATLGKFDVLFGAPSLSSSTQSYWVPSHPPTVLPKLYPIPQVFKDPENNIIYAHSDGKFYTINLSILHHCEVIGFDGVGCYSV